MNLNDLKDAVAEKAGISKADAGTAVGAVLDTISETLTKGEKIALLRAAERKWSTEGAGYSGSGRSKSPPACSLRSLIRDGKAGGCSPWTFTAGSGLPVAMTA